VLDGLDDLVHLAGEDLLGDAEREALGGLGRDVGGQGEGVAVHDHVHHDPSAGVGERRVQGVAHVAGFLDAHAAGAECRGDLAEVRVREIGAPEAPTCTGAWTPVYQNERRRLRPIEEMEPDADKHALIRHSTGSFHG
jgi:hypothetical protein